MPALRVTGRVDACWRQVICHGIPDSSILNDCDIINIDITCYYGGYHGDCSETCAAVTRTKPS